MAIAAFSNSLADLLPLVRSGAYVANAQQRRPQLVFQSMASDYSYDYNNAKVLPAHETKHLSLLIYPFRDNIALHLTQRDDGVNNGTALWLGAQILSAFLSDSLGRIGRVQMVWSTHCSQPSSPSFPTKNQNINFPCRSGAWNPRPRAIELGSGVGLTALVLAAQGWSVLATDTPAVVHSVLRPNILRNCTSNTRYTADTPVTEMTTCCLPGVPGTVQARALDWSVSPEWWVWDDPESVTHPDVTSSGKPNSNSTKPEDEVDGGQLLGPPFDLIITSDTIYSAELTAPLLRALKHLILLSTSPPSPNPPPAFGSEGTTQQKRKQKSSSSRPLVYLALERRDSDLVDSFFLQAWDAHGLNAQRIPAPRVRRAMCRAGLGEWKSKDREGVEVWRLSLREDLQ